MTLARRAEIHTADTFAIPLTYGHAVAIRRFDRQGTRRLHAISANVALRAAREPMGYPELAQLIRRRGAVADGRHVVQMRELFRRMVFNILMDNTDDHEKNHALLMTDAAEYELAPAYDVLPAGQALGFQQMRVGKDGADSTLENALSMCDQFSLKLADARLELQKVATVVEGWRAHFRAHSVSEGDIDLLAEQIDRSFLSKQRHEALRGVSR
jgi:serine/threonine-protein kinase HipA